MNMEQIITKNLIWNEDYYKKVFPFLKEEYFHNSNEKLLFNLIREFILKYKTRPTIEAILIALNSVQNISEDAFKNSKEILETIKNDKEESNIDWLLSETEKFCQDKSIYNAVVESIQILDNKSKNLDKGSIPKILSDALSVTFKTNIGHDYLEDALGRFDYYHKKEIKVPFDIQILNKVTNGGVSRKTLNIIMAGINVGKTLAMCHMAAANLLNGEDVLYITMEISEEEIGKRIDANLLNVSFTDLMMLSKEEYTKKISTIKKKTTGKLFVKEYPTAGASVTNFIHLLNELRLKKKFIPKIIYIDYLNICSSARLKPGGTNMYGYVKSIAEEIRGLAVEFDVPIISATQVNRAGFNDADFDMTETSESFGLPMTADLVLGLINTDELEELNQLMCKQIKSRYSDKSKNRRFVIGVDRTKMRLYDVEESAQEDIIDNASTNSKQQQQQHKPKVSTPKIEKKNFTGLQY